MASRVLNDKTEWELDSAVFRTLCTLHSISPTIDLFVSHLNTKLQKFVSFTPDPHCFHVDASTLTWSEVSYIFAPFILLNRVLQKIIKEQVTALMILPLWPTQPWFATMLHSAVDRPTLLPHPPPISLPWNWDLLHPNSSQIKLISITLSGDASLHKAFNDKPLLTSSLRS